MRQYQMVEHLCRHCGFGRVLLSIGTKQTPDGVVPDNRYRCSCCGKEEAKLKDICFCGHKYPSGASSRVRCVRNTEITEERPFEVVLVQEELGCRDAIMEEQ